MLQRADKPDPYDLQWVRPRALVNRRHCLGIAERIGPEGDRSHAEEAFRLWKEAEGLANRLLPEWLNKGAPGQQGEKPMGAIRTNVVSRIFRRR